MLLRRLILTIIVFWCIGNAVASESNSPWQFEVGASVGRPTPIMLNVGVGYKNGFFRVAAGGWHLEPNEFWVGYRGSLAWKFFRELPFSLLLFGDSGSLFRTRQKAEQKSKK